MDQNKMEKLQLLEQNLQNYGQQRQQYQLQLKEVDSALNELSNSKEQYKIIGNIMIDSSKDSLKEELKKKKETFQIRIKNIESQEEKIRAKAKEIQEEIMEKKGDDENDNR